MTPILYDYWRSSAAYRVRIALNLIGLPYDSVPVDLLTAQHRTPENLARNPQGLVPTLEIDGLTLTQSLAIIEYLNDTRAAGFLPADPAGRARVRALSYAIAMEIAPICNLSTRNHAAKVSGGGITADDWVRHFMQPGLAAFEAMLAGPGPFCHGSTVTMADICLVPQIYNARRLALNLSPLPRITAVIAALEAIPAIAAAHPDRLAP
ncbi:MAG: maleylacetoacetate isomerase [Paracoccaceae bacterium]